MRRALCGALLALVAPSPAHAVVNGRDASRPYPFMAELRNDGSFSCGGSLVRPDWVLTAGHCVTDGEDVLPASALSFGIGSAVRSRTEADGEVVPAAQVVRHPDYGAQLRNDVALVRLARPAVKGVPIRVADPFLPTDRALWEPGLELRVLGWGGRFYPGVSGVNTTDVLQEVDVPRVADEDCAAAYPPGHPVGAFDPAHQLCAGNVQGTEDSCGGDSGGPLLAPRPDGGDVLVGVVSKGTACGLPAQPGIYARVGDAPLAAFLRRTLPAPPVVVEAVQPFTASLRLGRVAGARRFVTRGLRFRLRCSAACAVRVRGTVDRAGARRLRLPSRRLTGDEFLMQSPGARTGAVRPARPPRGRSRPRGPATLTVVAEVGHSGGGLKLTRRFRLR